jgi:nicotinamide-nucleotide amidase
LIESIYQHLLKNQKTLALVESCTGGGLCREFVLIPGASEVFRGSLVAYQDFSKANCLGISQSLIDEHTSVSNEVALEMCKKGASFFQADYCLSTTGWAGPGGGSAADPVGTVYFAVCGESFELVERRTFKGCNERASLMDSANKYAWDFFAKALQL